MTIGRASTLCTFFGWWGRSFLSDHHLIRPDKQPWRHRAVEFPEDAHGTTAFMGEIACCSKEYVWLCYLSDLLELPDK